MAKENETDENHAASLSSDGKPFAALEKSKQLSKELITKNITDLVDYYVELITEHQSNRLEHWDCLRYFWGLHIANKIQFGRLYCRVRMAELIKDACAVPPYGHLDREHSKHHLAAANVPAFSPKDPQDRIHLVYWDRERWDDFMDDIESVADSLKRKDSFLEIKIEEQLSKVPNPERNDKDVVPQRVKTIRTLVEIQKGLAPLREALEEQIMQSDRESFTLDSEKVKEFVNYVNALEDDSVRCTLSTFLVNKSDSDENPQFDFVEPDAVRSLLEENKAFDLTYFQTKIEKLVTRWNLSVYGIKKEPMLIRLKYHLNTGAITSTVRGSVGSSRRRSTSQIRCLGDARSVDTEDNGSPTSRVGRTPDEIQSLKQDRETLITQHGEDPLQESQLIASKAKRPRASLDGEGSASGLVQADDKRARLSISLELDKDDEEDDLERAQLSEVPERLKSVKAKRSPATAFRGRNPDDGIFDQTTGLVVKRRRWTDEEKIAVKEGVRKNGVGHWVRIKDDYPDILRNRTAIQIKDCWRTMVKRKEINFEVTEGGTGDFDSLDSNEMKEKEVDENEALEKDASDKETNDIGINGKDADDKSTHFVVEV